MIWRPKVGMRVELRYGRRWRESPTMARLHGARGTVRAVGAGPGPINAFVELDGYLGTSYSVPRGNLFRAEERDDA